MHMLHKQGEHLGLDACSQSLAGHAGSTLHVLVAGVGAGANQACLQLCGPLVGLERLSKLRQAVSQVGREGSIDLHPRNHTSPKHDHPPQACSLITIPERSDTSLNGCHRI